jgi:hypothetical protein
MSLALGIHKLRTDDSIHLKFLFKNVGASKVKMCVRVRVRVCSNSVTDSLISHFLISILS